MTCLVYPQSSESVECGQPTLKRSEGSLTALFVPQKLGYPKFGLVTFLYERWPLQDCKCPNMALINWLSKRQATVEGAVFGSEFVALKQGVETLRGIRYKLRMMGVPFDGPSYIYGDNMSVVNNTSKPESTLKKKSNSICNHFCEGGCCDEGMFDNLDSHPQELG